MEAIFPMIGGIRSTRIICGCMFRKTRNFLRQRGRRKNSMILRWIMTFSDSGAIPMLKTKKKKNDADNPADTYSLLAQKQSGSAGSKLISSVKFPEKFKINWKYPDEIREAGNEIKIDTDLVNDKLIGAAFVKK